MAPSTVYRYKVKAINDAGEAESSVLTLTATPAAIAQTVPDNRMWIGANTGGTGFSVQTPEKVGIQHLGNGRYRVSDVSINTGLRQVLSRRSFMLMARRPLLEVHQHPVLLTR